MALDFFKKLGEKVKKKVSAALPELPTLSIAKPPEKKMVFPVGEGLKEGTTLPPGPTRALAALPKDERVKFALDELPNISPSAVAKATIARVTRPLSEPEKRLSGETQGFLPAEPIQEQIARGTFGGRVPGEEKVAKNIIERAAKAGDISGEERTRLLAGLPIEKPLSGDLATASGIMKKRGEVVEQGSLALVGGMADISRAAISALERSLGRKLVAEEVDDVARYLQKLRGQGKAMVDVTPEGPVFKDLLERVERKQLSLLPEPPVASKTALEGEVVPETGVLPSEAPKTLPAPASKPTIPPELQPLTGGAPKVLDEQNQAEQFWEENYAKRYGDLANREMELGQQLKTSNKAEKLVLQNEQKKITQEMVGIEEDFLRRFGDQPKVTSEIVPPAPTPPKAEIAPTERPVLPERPTTLPTPETPPPALPVKPQMASQDLFKKIGEQVAPQDFIAAERLRQRRIKEYLEEQGPKLEAERELQMQDLENLNSEVIQGIKNSTYFRKEGGVSDAMGEGLLMKNNAGRFVVATTRKGKNNLSEAERLFTKGYRTVIEIDSLAKEAGFEQGISFLEKQLALSKIKPVADYRMLAEEALKKTDPIFRVAVEKIEKVKTGLRGEVVPAEQFFRQMGRADKQKRRQDIVRSVQNYFSLSDAEMRKISRQDLRSMSDEQFDDFLKGLEGKARVAAEKQQALNELTATIKEKELKKIDNFRRSLKLPSIEKMTIAQLRQFDEALEEFAPGSEFLSKRTLETIGNTDFAEAKTIQQVLEKISEKTGIPLDGLKNITAKHRDYFLYDTPLAERNHLYRFMVDQWNALHLQAIQNELTMKKVVNGFARKARGKYQFVPQDTKVFNWLNAPLDQKLKLAKDMTPAELDFARFVYTEFVKMRDDLIARGTLDKYRQDYITFIQKGFFEQIKDGKIKEAVKNIFQSNREMEADFKALAALGDSSEGISFEKFFQFAQKRTGKVDPTKNVARAFLSYYNAYQRKVLADQLVPQIKAFVAALHPARTPERKELEQFINAWLNNKKGVRKEYAIKRNTVADIGLRTLNTFVSLIDLGVSLPVGLGTNVGEGILNLASLGPKQFALAQRRKLTPQGKLILQRYEEFVGENPWIALADASKDIGDQLLEAAFIFFRDSAVRANKTFLLGSLTDEEFAKGIVTKERLAEIRRKLGNYRIVEGASSVAGSTPEGKVLLKYKAWAVPALTTQVKNTERLIKVISDKGARAAFRSPEFQEFARSTLLTSAVGLFIVAYLNADKNDKSFMGRLKSKVSSESLSMLSVLDPMFWFSTPRVLSFLQALALGIKQLILLEEYERKTDTAKKGDLKGPKTLQRTLTPSFFRQFAPNKKKATAGAGLPGLPSLPELPDLPSL